MATQLNGRATGIANVAPLRPAGASPHRRPPAPR